MWRARCLLLAAVCAALATPSAADICGTVVNARGGEPLRAVRITLLETGESTSTGDDGAFCLGPQAPGRYTLRADAIGFWLQRAQVEVESASPEVELSIALLAEGLRHKEEIEVKGELFAVPEGGGAAQVDLTAGELHAAATVLTSDPFRAVQALPGVSAAGNNDFFGQFTLRGAAFERIGVYVDEIRLRQPFHGVPGEPEGGSVSVLHSDLVESLALSPAAFSQRYGDATGGALDLRTREGSRARTMGRLSLGLAESHATVEGPLGGGARRGAWLLSGRKSYMGYLTRRQFDEEAVDVSFYDATVKLTYDFTAAQTVEFFAVHARTGMDRQQARPLLTDPDLLAGGENAFDLGRVGWRIAPTPRLVLNTRAAYVRQNYGTENATHDVLRDSRYKEWTSGATLVWKWGPAHVLEMGGNWRRLSESGERHFYGAFAFSSGFAGMAQRGGAYVQQGSTLWGERVHLVGGVRWDEHSQVAQRPISPQASVRLRLSAATQLQAGLGRYHRSPSDVFPQSFFPSLGLCPAVLMLDRSIHYTAAVEQRLGAQGRLRVEFFDRRDQQRLGRGALETGGGCGPPRALGIAPALRGRARGMEILLQRRSSNRLSGWMSYTLVSAAQRLEVFDLPRGASPFDQRHTATAFATYRISSSMIIGGKWLYGSGFALPNVERVGDRFFAAPSSAQYSRLDPYQRLDLQVNRSFFIRQRKAAVYFEALNVSNHRNLRYVGFEDVIPETGEVLLRRLRSLGRTPTAGLVLHF
jgi:hypothetical protein